MQVPMLKPRLTGIYVRLSFDDKFRETEEGLDKVVNAIMAVDKAEKLPEFLSVLFFDLFCRWGERKETKTFNPKPELETKTRNPKPKTKNQKPKPKLKTENPKH
jgi:hypothetical protein